MFLGIVEPPNLVSARVAIRNNKNKQRTMYHLCKGLYDNYNKKQEYSIVLLGLNNAGKTTFLEKLKEIYNPNYQKPKKKILPTVGQNVAVIPVDNKTNLKIWDLSGQKELRALWENYYEVAHAIVFLVDSNDKDNLEECKDEMMKILVADEENNEGGVDKSIPILMLANKQDLEPHMEVEDIKEIFNKMAEHLNARDSRVLPVSALQGEGVKDAVDWLLVRVDRNKGNRPPRYR